MQENQYHNEQKTTTNVSKFDLRTMFLANSGGLSSKRILGVIGFLVCIGLLIFAFILEKEVPSFADMVLVASSSLIGVDSFKNIFSKTTS